MITTLAHLVMAAFPLAGIVAAFMIRQRHRAVLTILLAGFLFLPSIWYDFGPLNVTRWSLPILTALLALLLVEPARLARLRPQAADIPVVLWCLAPGFSSLSNGFGLYDAASATVYQSILWGGTWLLGRTCFAGREELIDLARFVVYGCLVYTPLCLYEWRFSPQLHLDLYGFHQHEFQQTIRAVGYRPMVFLQHGLMTAMWMGMGVFLAGVLTRARLFPPLLGLPGGFWTLILTGTFLLMQSFGAIALLLGAWTVFQLTLGMRNRAALLALAILPMTWAGLRVVGAMPSRPLVETAAKVSPERAESLGARLYAEDELIRHVQSRPLFGWGSWGRDRTVEGEYEEERLVIDGLWILTLSRNGLYGLAALLLFWSIPVFAVVRRLRAELWLGDPAAMVIGGLGIVLAVSMVDNLMNAMLILPFMLLIGALPGAMRHWDEGAPEAAPPVPEDAPVRPLGPGDGPRPRILGS